MGIEEDSYLIQSAECYYQTMIAKQELAIISELELMPCRDGNQFCFLWGEDLQSGIAGFGDSVSEAVKDFNKNYYMDFSK